MTMKEITDGLKKLLSDNHYNPVTIQFYEQHHAYTYLPVTVFSHTFYYQLCFL